MAFRANGKLQKETGDQNVMPQLDDFAKVFLVQLVHLREDETRETPTSPDRFDPAVMCTKRKSQNRPSARLLWDSHLKCSKRLLSLREWP